jgi:hypothetical protein
MAATPAVVQAKPIETFGIAALQSVAALAKQFVMRRVAASPASVPDRP